MQLGMLNSSLTNLYPQCYNNKTNKGENKYEHCKGNQKH